MSSEPTGPTILVVDDDPDCVEIASRVLRREGYRVRGAGGGEECLRIVRAEAIDLLLLDVGMPDMDGFAVCAALHADGITVPVVLLTGRDDTDTRLGGMQHGVTEFLTKPISPAELVARVRAQLHILELGRRLEEVEQQLRRLRPERVPGSTN